MRVGGFDAELDPRFTRRSDFSGYTVGSFRYAYDPQDYEGRLLEATATLYATRHRRERRVDLDYFELTFGPRLPVLKESAPGSTLRPYVLGALVLLDQAQYYSAGGFGARLQTGLGPRTLASIAAEARDRQYRDSATSSANSRKTGIETSLRAEIQQGLSEEVNLNLGLTAAQASAAAAAESSYSFGASVGLSLTRPGPFGLAPLPWVSSIAVSHSRAFYAEPDAAIDPDIARADRDWAVFLATSLQIDTNLAMILGIERFVRESTLSNFTYSNTSISVGPTWRF